MTTRNDNPFDRSPRKPIDLNPKSEPSPPDPPNQYDQDRKKTEAERIWKLVRQAAGEIVDPEPPPEDFPGDFIPY